MVDEVKGELLAIRQASPDGLLHAEDGVTWAKDHPGSELHKRLEWNDAVAGHEYRLEQMRGLIRLHIRIETGEPQFISLTYDRTRGGGYRDKTEVFRSRHLAEMAEQDALRVLLGVRRKYAHIKKLASVWHEVDRVETTMGGHSASPPTAPAA